MIFQPRRAVEIRACVPVPAGDQGKIVVTGDQFFCGTCRRYAIRVTCRREVGSHPGSLLFGARKGLHLHKCGYARFRYGSCE